jgi:hypothetical protein
MQDFEDDWTPEERELLRELSRSRATFVNHEDRTVRALQREGLVNRDRGWKLGLQFAGMAAALALAFFLGTEFQKTRGASGPMTLAPQEAVVPTNVVYHLDLDDPLADSFSEADAHPKVRLAKLLAMHEAP